MFRFSVPWLVALILIFLCCRQTVQECFKATRAAYWVWIFRYFYLFGGFRTPSEFFLNSSQHSWLYPFHFGSSCPFAFATRNNSSEIRLSYFFILLRRRPFLLIPLNFSFSFRVSFLAAELFLWGLFHFFWNFGWCFSIRCWFLPFLRSGVSVNEWSFWVPFHGWEATLFFSCCCWLQSPAVFFPVPVFVHLSTIFYSHFFSTKSLPIFPQLNLNTQIKWVSWVYYYFPICFTVVNF